MYDQENKDHPIHRRNRLRRDMTINRDVCVTVSKEIARRNAWPQKLDAISDEKDLNQALVAVWTLSLRKSTTKGKALQYNVRLYASDKTNELVFIQE